MDEPKRSRGFVPLLFSAIIGAVYLGFMVPYQFFTAPANVEELADLVMGKVGFHVELSMVMPHLICFGAALFFNFLGALFLKRLLVLFSILLYGASIALFYPYGPFALAAILFSLIGMFRIRRKKHGKKHSAEVPAPPEETTSAPAQPAAPAPAQPTAPEPAQPAAAPTQPTATATPAQPAAPAPAQTTAPEQYCAEQF